MAVGVAVIAIVKKASVHGTSCCPLTCSGVHPSSEMSHTVCCANVYLSTSPLPVGTRRSPTVTDWTQQVGWLCSVQLLLAAAESSGTVSCVGVCGQQGTGTLPQSWGGVCQGGWGWGRGCMCTYVCTH